MQCEPGEVAVLREQIASKDAQIVKLQARIAELEREAAERAAGSDVENDPPDETPRRRRKRKQRLAQLKRRLAARDTAAAGGSGDAAGDAGTADQEPSGEGGGADDTAGEDGGADDTAGEDGGADGTPAVSGSAVRLLVGQLEMELLIRLEEIEFKDKINDLQPAYGCTLTARTALRVRRRESSWRCTARSVSSRKRRRTARSPGLRTTGRTCSSGTALRVCDCRLMTRAAASTRRIPPCPARARHRWRISWRCLHGACVSGSRPWTRAGRARDTTVLRVQSLHGQATWTNLQTGSWNLRGRHVRQRERRVRHIGTYETVNVCSAERAPRVVRCMCM